MAPVDQGLKIIPFCCIFIQIMCLLINKTEHAAQSYAAGKDYLDCNVEKKGPKKKKKGNRLKKKVKRANDKGMLSKC